MSSCRVTVPADCNLIDDVMEVRTSVDLVHWSEPTRFVKDGKAFGNHYVAMVADDGQNQPCVVDGDEFSILTNHNGTDVNRFQCKFIQK
jgi:hypothetical protein